MSEATAPRIHKDEAVSHSHFIDLCIQKRINAIARSIEYRFKTKIASLEAQIAQLKTENSRHEQANLIRANDQTNSTKHDQTSGEQIIFPYTPIPTQPNTIYNFLKRKHNKMEISEIPEFGNYNEETLKTVKITEMECKKLQTQDTKKPCQMETTSPEGTNQRQVNEKPPGNSELTASKMASITKGSNPYSTLTTGKQYKSSGDLDYSEGSTKYIHRIFKMLNIPFPRFDFVKQEEIEDICLHIVQDSKPWACLEEKQVGAIISKHLGKLSRKRFNTLSKSLANFARKLITIMDTLE